MLQNGFSVMNVEFPQLFHSFIASLQFYSCKLKVVKVVSFSILSVAEWVLWLRLDVRGWDCLTDLGPLIFWLLRVNWGGDQWKPRLLSAHILVTNAGLGVRNSCDNLLCWNLQLSSSFCFSHTFSPQWEIEPQSHSSIIPRSAILHFVSHVDQSD